MNHPRANNTNKPPPGGTAKAVPPTYMETASLQPNNPAGRLLAITNHPDFNASHRNSGEAWSKILGIPRDSSPFLASLAQALNLPWQIEKEILSISDMNHAVYLAWLPEVKQIFSAVQIEIPFQYYTQALNANVQALIAVCDEQLSRSRPEPVLDEGRKTDLSDKIEQLRADIESDLDLSSETREYIKYHIDLIQNAIHDYKIQGMAAILHAAERSVGSAYIRRSDFEIAQETKHGEKFNMTLAALVLAAFAAYPQFKEISGDLIKLLPGTANTEEVSSE